MRCSQDTSQRQSDMLQNLLRLNVLPLAALCAVLAASCVVAQTAPRSPSDLQDLVLALSQQIDMRHGAESSLGRELRDETRGVLAAWNASPQSASDHAAMEAWLRASVRGLMPGGGEMLPASPKFSLPAPTLVRKAVAGDSPAPAGAIAPSMAADSPTGGRRTASKPVVEPTAPPATRPSESAPGGRVWDESPAAEPPQRSKWSDHPGAAPIEWVDPFTDDPLGSAEPLRYETRKPVLGETRINVNELASRTRGFNAALRAVQLELLEQTGSDAGRLSEAFNRLDLLVDQARFIDMYLDRLPPGGRGALPRRTELGIVVELLKRRVDSRLTQGTAQQTERERLERLSARVVRLEGQLGEENLGRH
ncbi:hypothetical protein Mal64_25100 [Pseudobythopirellula maris]|uniref:Uncharacterized protein n=1 Tax=Pseudobythopirellula maris TaxID=2527991 RepID=A0A5C5ZNJ3_9BACT|nr:hypothetical protein [Pseudobythopirellula maris]TWT89019.1 hypothetical protein Mal64_25100 [Pseudobythopirellula maris]